MNIEDKAALILMIAIISMFIISFVVYSYPDATHLIIFFLIALGVIYSIFKK